VTDAVAFRALARRALEHFNANTTDQAPATLPVPVDAYRDPVRHTRELARIYRRVPLAVALSLELPQPRDYKAMKLMDTPLIVVRGDDGVVRTFLNACRHRGAAVCDEGRGHAARFLCKYHAWRYDLHGRLVAITDRAKFGDFDQAANSLVELPTAERSGFVWVCLTPGAIFDIDQWLGGMRAELDSLDLGNWYLYEQRDLPGPGWKVAWEGYLEAYHHQTVHATTLAEHTVGNLLVHDTWGPHQRLTFARRTLGSLNGVPEADWGDPQQHLRLIHSVFPSTAVSGILGDLCLVSQVFPGPTPTTTLTRQTVLAAREPVGADAKARAEAFSRLTRAAVEHEDYVVTATIQAGLTGPANTVFTIGRNEPAIQHYHQWVARLADDPLPASLPGLAS
jgi:phenylpropionate dioxygenase-like ring-hydroxylating dioxygenase large terminal subunit